jgi:hypothetical protein
VKIVTQVKLIPEADQASALSATLRTVNDLANWVSDVAFARDVPREYELRKHTYARLKASGLGAQAAQHVIKKVRDAYTTLHANIRAGNLGKKDSKRRRKAESKPITFRPEAAQPYDDRCLSWQYDRQTVSIWTEAGRLENVRFVCSADALKVLQQYRRGESDLIERGGVFYPIATCEVPEAETYEPDGFIGVDLGIVNIATTSTGYQAAGRGLNRYRKRQLALRAKPEGNPAEGTAPQAPTGRTPFLGLRPAWGVHRLQGTPGLGARGVRRSRVLLQGVRRLRPRAPAQPHLPSHVRMPVVRRRCARRPERFPRPRPQGRGRVDRGA